MIAKRRIPSETAAMKISRTVVLAMVICATVSMAGPKGEPKENTRPKVAGRPSLVKFGQELVLPENVERSPEIYRGAIGQTPLALIRAGDKVVGEIYAAQLPKDATVEADDMAASVKDKAVMSLVNRGTRMDGDRKLEVATIKLDIRSPLGKPLILYSLYFSMEGKKSATFKLATGLANFEATLPYLEAMLGLAVEKGGGDSKRGEGGEKDKRLRE